MAFRVAPQAQADLDEIRSYLANESGSPDIATRLLQSIAKHFLLLSRHSRAGIVRNNLSIAGLRAFPSGNYIMSYVIEGADVLVLRVVHSHRDVESQFSEPLISCSKGECYVRKHHAA